MSVTRVSVYVIGFGDLNAVYYIIAEQITAIVELDKSTFALVHQILWGVDIVFRGRLNSQTWLTDGGDYANNPGKEVSPTYWFFIHVERVVSDNAAVLQFL